jgi:hypothetical protein
MQEESSIRKEQVRRAGNFLVAMTVKEADKKGEI